MKSIFTLICLFWIHSAYALDAVPHVELERYLGTWYEIAKYPNRFQKECLLSKADYSLSKSGEIEVNNRCLKADGSFDQAIGKAYVVSPSNAKLKVQFFLKFFNFSFLQGDYWVVKLDENYQYVVVSEPSQEYLWILSRTPQMNENTYQELIAWLVVQNFDVSKIIKDDWSSTSNMSW